MNGDQQTQLLAEPREVDVVAIEREVTALWKDASGGSDPSVTRACALNFIVVTENEEELDELANMAGEVSLAHPARIFLIVANRAGASPKLDAWISARCSLPVPGGKQVCCEQINLTAHGPEAQKIPSIVTSLLVSDVPTVLLWKAEVNVGNEVLLDLAKVVDRILIDSSKDMMPEPALAAWRTLVSTGKGNATFGDLAWTRLVPWRSLVAGAFNSPEMRAMLSSISSVMVEYSSTSRPQHSGLSQALLLVAWLANKLKWQPHTPLTISGTGEYTAVLLLGEKTINIRVTPVAAQAHSPGAIESVALYIRGGPSLTFSATEYQHCVRQTTEQHGTSSETLISVASDKSEALLIARELEVMTRDVGYESVLATLTTMLRG